MSTLYENIKIYCDKAGISGAKLCADAGISKSTLTSLKNGRTKKISTDNLAKMAVRLGVSVDELLGSDQKEKSPASEDVGLDEELIRLLCDLSPDEKKQVGAFVQGLRAGRAAPTSDRK